MVFHWAGRVIDLWLALTRLVRYARGAWRALPGDAMALLVMHACGIDSPGREAREGDISAVLIEDPRAALYLDHQWMPVHAQTLGRYIFARERLADRTVAHELEHVRQWSRLGPLFLPAYALSSGLAILNGRRPYDANRFEEAARRREVAPPVPKPDES